MKNYWLSIAKNEANYTLVLDGSFFDQNYVKLGGLNYVMFIGGKKEEIEGKGLTKFYEEGQLYFPGFNHFMASYKLEDNAVVYHARGCGNTNDIYEIIPVVNNTQYDRLFVRATTKSSARLAVAGLNIQIKEVYQRGGYLEIDLVNI